MADDGLLLNFSVSDTPSVPVSAGQYKGRWKERALSKKWDKIKARRAFNGKPVAAPVSVRPSNAAPKETTTAELNTTKETREHRMDDGAGYTRGVKRKRGHASSANALPVIPRMKNSSSLFTGNPEIPQSVSKEQPQTEKTEEQQEQVPISPSNQPAPESLPATKPSPPAGTTNEFTSLGISPAICHYLSKSLSITTPTRIQSLSIPHLLTSPRDTFLRSQTGSGKTLAFLLPILHTLLSLPTPTNQLSRTSGLFAIILTPTRELAKQTEHVLTELTSGTWLVPGWLLGGERKKSEKARLRKGVNILVATPGRLMDHLESTMVFDTSMVRWMVLDEGDRLVDMGFLESVGKILRIVEARVQHRLMKDRREGVSVGGGKLPDRLVKVLCSATLRGEEGLGALETIVDPVFLKGEDALEQNGLATGEEGTEKMVPPGQLTQKTIILPAKLRLVTLLALLSSFASTPTARKPDPTDTTTDTTKHSGGTSKMIIFLSCSTSVSFHHRLLSSYSLPHTTLFLLHGTLDQATRTATLKAFTSLRNRHAVLLATDIASRGLDLDNLDRVVQFDPPASMDDYIHRVGRTARAGRTGEGVLFLLPSEEGYVDLLEGQMGLVVQRVKYEDVLKGAWGAKDWMDKATEMQLHAEKWVLEDQEVHIPPSKHSPFINPFSWLLERPPPTI